METFTISELGWVKPAAAFLLVFYGLATLIRALTRRKGLPLPPGPPGLPIIGNILDIPAEDYWLKYMEWSEQYGSDVLYLSLLGQDFIVLNSLSACKELLEKRSSIYSSRPIMPMVNDLIGFDWMFGFMPYGDEWKERRKLFTQAFGPSKVHLHRAHLLKHNRIFLLRLLEDPEHFRDHARMAAGAFVLEAAYGIDVKSPDDVYITGAERALLAMSASGTAASYLVDFIPILKHLPSWLPGTGFKREAEVWRPHVKAMPRDTFKFVEDSLKRGDAKPCVATQLIQALDEGDSEYENKKATIRDSLGSVYVGASDTTVSSVATFFLAMAQNPEVQKKSQSVVDRVVEVEGRLPDFTHFQKLPYIEAVVRELLRWKLVAPMAAPHSLIQDDVYKGFHIPQGATVTPNSFAITRDPTLYGPNTDLFDPTRFLDATQTEIKPDMPMGYDTFGFGRRMCPGMELAIESIWLTVVSTLAVFDIAKAGQEGDGSVKYTSGLISHPLPFKVKITPRSKEAEDWIRSSVVAGV